METDIDKKIQSTKSAKEQKERAEQKAEHPVEHKTHETHEPEKAAVEETAPPSSRKIWPIVFGIIIVLAIVAGGYYYWTTMGTTTQVVVKETQPKKEVVEQPAVEQPVEIPEEVVEKPVEVPVEEVVEKEEVAVVKNETVAQPEGEVSLAEYVFKEGEIVLREGNFIKAKSSPVITRGRVLLIKNPDSSYKIVFDKFTTGETKKVNHVYLVEKEPQNTQDIVKFAIDLGELKSREGVQEYEIKEGRDIELKRVVTLYDPTYQIINANAPLNPK